MRTTAEIKRHYPHLGLFASMNDPDVHGRMFQRSIKLKREKIFTGK